MRAVLLEDTGGRKLAQLMSNHILSDKNRIKNLPVVNQESVADEIWRYRRTTRPSFDWAFDAGIVNLIDLFEEMLLNERTFFERSAHTDGIIKLLASLTAFNDETITALVFATCLEATRQLPPWTAKMLATATTLRLALTTTIWMIDGVHDHTSDGWANTLPATTTSLTAGNIHVVHVTDLAHRSVAVLVDPTNLTGRQLQKSIALFAV